MDTRHAFLESAESFIAGIHDLMCFRIVGNSISVITLQVNAIHRKKYAKSKLPVIQHLREIAPYELFTYEKVYAESSIIFAYAILDSFLSEVEEVIFLHNPVSLGEDIQIKLGKILTVTKLEDLVHEIAKRRTRERAFWSLQRRLSDLKDRHDIAVSLEENQIDWLSKTRNEITHNRRSGAFTVKGQSVSYHRTKLAGDSQRLVVENSLCLICNIIRDLYLGTCRYLGINRRFALHKANLLVVDRLGKLWQPKASKTSEEG